MVAQMSDGIELSICAFLHVVFLLSWYLTECKLTIEDWSFSLLLPLDIIYWWTKLDKILWMLEQSCNRYSNTKCILVLVPLFMVPKLPTCKIYVYFNAYTFMDIVNPASLFQLSLRYHSLHQNTIPHNTYFYLFNGYTIYTLKGKLHLGSQITYLVVCLR